MIYLTYEFECQICKKMVKNKTISHFIGQEISKPHLPYNWIHFNDFIICNEHQAVLTIDGKTVVDVGKSKDITEFYQPNLKEYKEEGK